MAQGKRLRSQNYFLRQTKPPASWDLAGGAVEWASTCHVGGGDGVGQRQAHMEGRDSCINPGHLGPFFERGQAPREAHDAASFLLYKRDLLSAALSAA